MEIVWQGYCWLENVRGHFVEKAKLESLLPISLHYKTGPLFQNEGAILKIKGQICPWPLPKLSLVGYSHSLIGNRTEPVRCPRGVSMISD